MLKKFFISLLGTIAGLWISGLIVFILIIAAIGSLGSSEPKVENKSILYIDLNGDIVEREQEQSLLSIIQQIDSEQGPTLSDMVNALNKAADDSKISGLYVNAGNAEIDPASCQELIEAIAKFKESGKWYVAYGDNYTEFNYLIAASADKVYLNPVGSVDIHGVGSVTPFFTGLLDKLGVKVQVVKVGTYKSAVEPYILTSMSDAARHQNQVFIDSIWGYYTTTVADARGVSPATVNAWADSLTMTWSAAKAVEANIVTEALYRRQVEAELRERTDVEADQDLRLVTPSEYLTTVQSPSSSKPHVAVLYALGEIVDEGDEGIVGANLTPQIIDLADDENVRGLVMRVNSPGGSAFASEQIWEALQYFKSTGKPFYVSMGDYAASGGYYISCGADRIYADASTLTGSIGVFGLIPDLSGLVTDKLGVTFSEVLSNKNANFGSFMKPLSPYQLQAMQNFVNQTYETFVTRVADGRHMSVDSVKAIAEGRVWVATSAVNIGLVDNIGTLNTAVADMCSNLDLNPEKSVVCYPNDFASSFEAFLQQADRIQAAGLKLDPQSLGYLLMVKRLSEANPIQARMPEIMIR